MVNGPRCCIQESTWAAACIRICTTPRCPARAARNKGVEPRCREYSTLSWYHMQRWRYPEYGGLIWISCSSGLRSLDLCGIIQVVAFRQHSPTKMLIFNHEYYIINIMKYYEFCSFKGFARLALRSHSSLQTLYQTKNPASHDQPLDMFATNSAIAKCHKPHPPWG